MEESCLGGQWQEMLFLLKVAVGNLSRNTALIQRDEGTVVDYQASAAVLPTKDFQSDFHKPLCSTRELGACSAPIRSALCGGPVVITALNSASEKYSSQILSRG